MADEQKTVYDIEMQTASNINLPKRSRYYQGMIDLNLIKKGEDYKMLRKSYVIFICKFGPFGKGQKISKELKDFLEYLVTHNCNSDFTRQLDKQVKSIIESEEWRLEYMTLKMRDRENIEAGRKEGRDETIRTMLLNKKTPEDIAEFCSIPIEVIKEVEKTIKTMYE